MPTVCYAYAVVKFEVFWGAFAFGVGAAIANHFTTHY